MATSSSTRRLGSAAAWPVVAWAQQTAMPVIGFLNGASPEPFASRVPAFRKGLGETGYIEGRNLTIEYRWAQNELERLPEMAVDLVRRGVSAIVTSGSTPATLAAKAATMTIPIVFQTAADPVATGLVASLNRPGGNATGVSSTNTELGSKRLGLLRELLPSAARFAVLVNPNNPQTETFVADLSSNLGARIEVVTARTGDEVETAFARLVQGRTDALLVGPDATFSARRVQLITWATRHALPTIYPDREYADAGGLMS
jgi:putative tryptophan/tyrosine transport system substrate-binding protein